jgi:predicted nucleic acid-binding protein
MESMTALRGYSGAPARVYRCTLEIRWELLPIPPPQVLRRYQEYTAAKDVHVLASACEGGSEFLLTLDKRHLLSVAPAGTEGGPKVTILTPGEFIRDYYTRHEDYPRLPPERSSG